MTPESEKSPIGNATRTQWFDEDGNCDRAEWELLNDECLAPNGKTVGVAGLRKGGIGAAIARLFALKGCFVIAADRFSKYAMPVIDEINRRGGRAEFVEADLGTEKGVDRYINEIAKHSQQLDVGIWNLGAAGDPKKDNLLDLSPRDFYRLLKNNLVAPFMLTQAALGYMLQQETGGTIVFLGSMNGQAGFGMFGQLGYATAKSALSGMMAVLTATYGHHVRFALARPSIVLTNSENWQERLKHNPNQADIEGLMSPAGKLATPEDVANAVYWMCSEEARFLNGVELQIDGGLGQSGIIHPAWDATNFRASYVAEAETHIEQKRKAA